jgi:hypothetical protein
MRTESFRQAVGALICLLLLIAIVPESGGQSSWASPGIQSVVTVTSPSGAASDVVADGDDFFTRALGDPRDMNDRLDLRWQQNVSNISVSGGLWEGDFEAGSTIYAHFPGLDKGAANIGPIGEQYPINTATYTQLSFRAHSPVGASYRWWAFPDLQSDGRVGPVASGSLAAGQWQLYTHSLGSGWSGSMQGLQLQLQDAASDFRLDWVRLTDPSTSPTFEITWGGAGSGEVDIYCDDDTNFGNGTIARIVDDTADDGSFTWQTAAFPPGAYYIYIEHSSDGAGNGDYSSGPLTVVETPILDFTAPSVTSGEDYATAVVGDAWDMDGWNDVLGGGNPVFSWTWHHLENVSFDGQMHASTTGNDPFIYTTVDLDNPIDADKYKYLTWNWYAEGEPVNADERLLSANKGWVTRFHYFVEYPYDTTRDMNTLNDLIIWEGWNTYTVDLSQGYLDDAQPGPGPGWTGTKTGLRFDFLEGQSPSDIHVDEVLLTADPTAQSGSSYAIEWEIQASDRPMTITLWYDNDTNPNNAFPDTEPIATLGPGGGGPLPPGPYYVYLPLALKNYAPGLPTENAYSWSVPGGLSGAYYLYAEVDDGLNEVGWYSDVPLVIE